jgi:threonylcarbamoyladenosine tRNA methylthiotransferase MtaB
MPQVELNSHKKKVAFHTLGCRLNFSETGSIVQGFEKRGYQVVPFGECADVVFVNTCTVTDAADSSCRNQIRKAQKSSPEGKIVVAGCYAQMEPETIERMQGVDLILGTSEKYKVFDYLEEDLEETIKIDKSNDFWGAATSLGDGHTRAFLKIQDGCNYICSFCIIPFARGRSRTITIQEAKSQVEQLVLDGFKEMVLTGVNIGEYESTSGEKLTDLIAEILSVDGLERLRLSSVEPNTITDELLEVLSSSPKFLDHFHIPMQSGDDTTLKNMRRKYTVKEYKSVINKIVKFFPNAGIGADVIAGFPGETKEQFQNTYNLLKELPITHFHVFPYSKRKGTTAAALDTHIPHDEKKSRVRALTMFGKAKLNEFSEDQIGSTQKVLFERRDKNGLYSGYTTNFVKVFVDTKSELKNQIHSVHIKEMKDNRLVAELIH